VMMIFLSNSKIRFCFWKIEVALKKTRHVSLYPDFPIFRYNRNHDVCCFGYRNNADFRDCRCIDRAYRNTYHDHDHGHDWIGDRHGIVVACCFYFHRHLIWKTYYFLVCCRTTNPWMNGRRNPSLKMASHSLKNRKRAVLMVVGRFSSQVVAFDYSCSGLLSQRSFHLLTYCL